MRADGRRGCERLEVDGVRGNLALVGQARGCGVVAQIQGDRRRAVAWIEGGELERERSVGELAMGRGER